MGGLKWHGGRCAGTSRKLMELPETSNKLDGGFPLGRKGCIIPHEERGFCNPCPSPTLYKGHGGLW